MFQTWRTLKDLKQHFSWSYRLNEQYIRRKKRAKGSIRSIFVEYGEVRKSDQYSFWSVTRKENSRFSILSATFQFGYFSPSKTIVFNIVSHFKGKVVIFGFTWGLQTFQGTKITWDNSFIQTSWKPFIESHPPNIQRFSCCSCRCFKVQELRWWLQWIVFWIWCVPWLMLAVMPWRRSWSIVGWVVAKPMNRELWP